MFSYANTAGSAAKATQDGNGRNIVNTYLPRSGGDVVFQAFVGSRYCGTDRVDLLPAKTRDSKIHAVAGMTVQICMCTIPVILV